MLRSRSAPRLDRTGCSEAWGGATWADVAEPRLTSRNALPQITADYRLLPRACARDVPCPRALILHAFIEQAVFWITLCALLAATIIVSDHA